MGDGVLDQETILELISSSHPLVEGYLDLSSQLQPNGFDLTLREVSRFTSAGAVHSGTTPSTLAQSISMPFDSEGKLHLAKGAYMVTLNEVVNLPHQVMALARPRSSLLRSGVAIHTAVWDAGYRGRSQALLTVYNPLGYGLARDARILQMVFLHLARPVHEGYQGRFLNENI